MKITVDLVFPSVENLGTDSFVIKEGVQIVVTHILETQYARHKILLNVGDQFFVSDLKDTSCPIRLVVLQRIFHLSLTDEKEESVHFVMVEPK
ncbi:MAG: hypothetical protein WBG90_14880 [Saonia sp.]